MPQPVSIQTRLPLQAENEKTVTNPAMLLAGSATCLEHPPTFTTVKEFRVVVILQVFLKSARVLLIERK
jgi:hypothetical protein